MRKPHLVIGSTVVVVGVHSHGLEGRVVERHANGNWIVDTGFGQEDFMADELRVIHPMDIAIRDFAARLERVYNNRSAGEYTWVGLLYEFGTLAYEIGVEDAS